MQHRKDFLVFGSQLIEKAEIAEVEVSLRSGWIGSGPKVHRFEEMFREFTGARYALALSPKLSDADVADVIAAVRGILIQFFR